MPTYPPFKPHPEATLERHYLSAVFGDMQQVEFDELVDSIGDDGMKEAITMLDGNVFDGWHRYHACLYAGVQPRFEDYVGDVPVRDALIANLYRRHIIWNPSQRAVLVVRANKWRESGSNEGLTVLEMANEAGVSDRTIQRAKRAEERGEGDQILSGSIRVSTLLDGNIPVPVEPEEIDISPLMRLRMENTALVKAQRESQQTISDYQDRIAFLESVNLEPGNAVLERRFQELNKVINVLRLEKEELVQALGESRTRIRQLHNDLRGIKEQLRTEWAANG